MDYIFTEGIRGRSLFLDRNDSSISDDGMGFTGESLIEAMESVRSSRLPEIPHLGVTQSTSSAGFGKFLIDNPRDQELKKREQLWHFHKKNRGAMVRLKGLEPTVSKIKPDGGTDEFDSDRKSDSENDTDKSVKGSKKVSKIRTRLKSDLRGSGLYNRDTLSSRRDGGARYTYSSALTIGNNIYTQLRGKERETLEYFAGDRNKKLSIVNSIDKIPDLSAALTKLGYLKMTKNVVHFGGGFFGRQTDKRFNDLRRSTSCLDPRSKPENDFIDQDLAQRHHYGSLQQLNSIVETSSIKIDSPKVRPLEEEEKKNTDSQTRRCINKKPSKANSLEVPKKSVIEELKLTEKSKTSLGSDCESVREALVEKKSKNVQVKKDCNNRTDRPASDISLDIPKNKFGPSSQLRENKSHKPPLTYGMNPFRWNNKSAITDEDKSWVERAIQNADVIDKSLYDGFARTKPVKSSVMSDSSDKEKSFLV